MSATAIKDVLASNPFISKQEIFLKASLLDARGNAILEVLVKNGLVVKDDSTRPHTYALAGAVKPEAPRASDEEILAFGDGKSFSMAELEKAFPHDRDLRDRVGAFVVTGSLFHNEKTRGRRYSSSKEVIEAEKEADRRG